MRTPMKTSVRSLSRMSARRGTTSTCQPVNAIAMSRNQVIPARPRLVRTRASSPPRKRASPLGEWHWLPRLRSDVFRLRPDYAVVGSLFEHVSAPARDARDCEGGREELLGQPDRLQDPGRVELDVGRL